MSADVETPPVVTEAPPAPPSDAAPADTPPPTPPADTDEPERRRRWPWIVALLVVFALLVAGGALAGATFAYAGSLDGRFLPGTVVAGVDVSGMTQDEALGQVRDAFAEQLDHKVVVTWGDQRWKARARKLGLRVDARRVLADVADAQSRVTWQDWARMRWLGETADVDAEVSVKHQRKGIRRFIAGIASDLDREARDADLDIRDGRVFVTREQLGLEVQQRKAVALLAATLEGGHTRMGLPVREFRPEVRDSEYDQVLLLDQSDRKLTLYLDGRKTRTWTVAIGTAGYPTPLGRYTVTEKRYMPTWINPDPKGWGADMPAQIGPGPGNPLGVRALNWSAPGAIRFHGTQAVNSLGTAASHGCVRMHNDDVTELYDLVDVGAIIVSQT